MAITNQAKLEFIPLDEELAPSSEGRVSDQGMHIPDVNLIDAYNTLPTIAGYSSFFGQGEYLDEVQLRSRSIQEIITFRTLHGDNIQLAFCREGLYMRSLAGDGIGTKAETSDKITIDMPDGKAEWIKVLRPEHGPASPWELWTFPIIENEMYIYIQGLGNIVRLTSEQPEQVIFELLNPTYIIGTDLLYEFSIHGFNDSEGDDTTKSVEINTDAGTYLGKYNHYQSSATLVDSTKMQIESSMMGAFSAEVIEKSKTITDIDAFIPINKTYVELLSLVDITHDGTDIDLIISIEGA